MYSPVEKDKLKQIEEIEEDIAHLLADGLFSFMTKGETQEVANDNVDVG